LWILTDLTFVTLMTDKDIAAGQRSDPQRLRSLQRLRMSEPGSKAFSQILRPKDKLMAKDYSNQPPTAFQRVPKYAREEAWTRAYLREAQVGHIASVMDGQPFQTPTTFWFDEANHRIIFHSNITGRIRSNLEKNPKVCLEASELGRLLPSNIAESE
jgi:hypothetical protein